MSDEKTIVIVCELGELEELTHQQARVFEDELRAAAAGVFPEHRIRGLWVHRAEARVAKLEQLRQDRSEARGLARILAHAYTTDNRPPRRTVEAALALPVMDDPND